MTSKTPSKSKTAKKQQTIRKRIEAQKKLFLEALEKIPIIQVACKRADISRATLYRWKEEDPDFALKVNGTHLEGTHTITDLAKSKLVEHIGNGNLTAIIFWLKTHDEEFVEKRKVDMEVQRIQREPLDPKTENLIRTAMGNFARVHARRKDLTPADPEYDDNDEDEEDED